MSQPWPRDSNETASDQPGAVQRVSIWRIDFFLGSLVCASISRRSVALRRQAPRRGVKSRDCAFDVPHDRDEGVRRRRQGLPLSEPWRRTYTSLAVSQRSNAGPGPVAAAVTWWIESANEANEKARRIYSGGL